MKKLILFLLLSPFALLANDAIVSDEVLKTMEKHFETNKSETQSLNPLPPCHTFGGNLTCRPPCGGGSTYIATLPETSPQAAYDFLLSMASSLCGGCGFSISGIAYNQAQCIDLP